MTDVTTLLLRLFLERKLMIDKLVFFNEFGAGDIFESREFVKSIMKLVPATEYYYSHGKHSRILLDIPELSFMDFDKTIFDSMTDLIRFENNSMAWNTWIGRDSSYVLPGIGCTPERLLDMHNEMLSKHSKQRLSGSAIDFIPDIDYSVYNTKGIDEFLENFKQEKIFIDNGLVQSMQASNFDTTDIIESVARNNANKVFIVSHAFLTTCTNIFDTSSLTSVSGFDLPEISYLSTFCSTLIGRNSGPHVFTQTKKNVMDPNKKLLSFTYKPQGASFVVNTPVKIRRYWSDATDVSGVIRKIEEVISE
jgi:hypothetical protein